MRYLSVCSGIEAATVAWHPLGWTAAAYSEIEKFPSQVLAHHYPNTPNVGDMTKFKEWNIGSIDLLVGGTPCQSFSVAGLRKGLDDPRGNLMLTYLAIADQYRPRWLVWENVPGVLSSNGGKDFGVFLGALGELGYGFAYRILDAQYFGVAQRRRRVFVVGYLGDWRTAAAVLFERHSLSGDSAPSREKRKEVAGGITHGLGDGGDLARCLNACNTASGRMDVSVETFVSQPIALQDITSREKAQNGKGWNADGSAYTVDTHATQGVAQPIPLNSMNCFRSPDADPSTGCGIGEEGEAMFTLSKTNSHAVAQPIPVGYSIREDAKANTFSATELNVSTALKALQPGVQSHHAQTFVAQPISFSGQMSEPLTDVDMTQTLQAKNPMAVCLIDQGGSVMNIENDLTGTLRRETHGHEPVVMQSMAVRRLTPVECERLQGFPDNYTNIKDKCPDGPRYKALGNSMAVPVMAWIGKRIQEVENLQCKPNK